MTPFEKIVETYWDNFHSKEAGAYEVALRAAIKEAIDAVMIDTQPSPKNLERLHNKITICWHCAESWSEARYTMLAKRDELLK